MKATNTSGYRGVYVTKNGKFSVSINFGGRKGKKISIGTFSRIEDAAYAYDLARIVIDEMLGIVTPSEHLNFPKMGYSDNELGNMRDFIVSKL